MVTQAIDTQLIAAVQDGLPLCSEPYAALAKQLGVSEDEVLRRLGTMVDDGTIKRLGVVVRHRALGYRANAMVVWDIPDDEVDRIGTAMGAMDGVTLCYRRPRRPPAWPYNLFCMIHGRQQSKVRQRVEEIAQSLALQQVRRDVLFSRRCFKQKGARYVAADTSEREGVGHASRCD